MRLLLFTQKVDKNDAVLGFMHRWICEFARHADRLHVVCLYEGEHDFPDHVAVHSLGKEHGVSRLTYIYRFYVYVWTLRSEYDAVFVHMNDIYVRMGGPVWGLLGKRVYLWRNHYEGGVWTNIASWFCSQIFCTSAASYTMRFAKTLRMPVGVSMECAAPETIERRPHSILFLGRFDESKRPDLLVAALARLAEANVEFQATFVGAPSDGSDEYYKQTVFAASAISCERITFVGAVPHHETPAYYRAHEIFVNLSAGGMFDKTMFEATACGALVVSSSPDMAALTGGDYSFRDGDVADLAACLERALTLTRSQRERVVEKRRRGMLEEHSLTRLAERVVGVMSA